MKRRTSEWFRMMERRREAAEAAGYKAGLEGRGDLSNPYLGKHWSEQLREAWRRGLRKGLRDRAPEQGRLEI